MNLWGISWGDSWGWSWGPLHEVEEKPGQVYGSGRKLPGPGPDPLLDGAPLVAQESEEDIVRLVHEKWDAIEAARAPVPKSSHVQAPSVLITESPAQPVIVAAPHTGPAAPIVPMVDQSAQEILARRRADEEAFILSMLELV